MASSKSMALREEDIQVMVDVANKAADMAGEIMRHYYCSKQKVDDKNGDGPVTIADKEAEGAMVSIILETFPDHAVYGEETGWHINSSSSCGENDEKPSFVADFIWVLDPIDGTTSFVGGHGCISLSFGSLIALLYKGKPILGCIDQPIDRLRWVGVKGRRTTLNGAPVSSVGCDNLQLAYVDLKAPNYNDDAKFAYDKIAYKVKMARIDGNCIAYGALASGSLNVVVDCGLDPFDFLALIPVVEGVGGVITDWQGGQLCWEANPADPSYGIPVGGFKVVAAGDAKTHQEVIALLSD